MNNRTKVLIVEDDLANSLILRKIMSNKGFEVELTNSGLEAAELLENTKFEIVLTDWMMPGMDGIELIKKIRSEISPPPIIIMITALASKDNKKYALNSGADYFITKPIFVDDIYECIEKGMNKKTQERKVRKRIDIEKIIPQNIAVAITTSTGGPTALLDLFTNIDIKSKAVFYVIQHGPAWMVDATCERLRRATKFKVEFATEGTVGKAGTIYFAPNGYHLKLDPDNCKTILEKGAKINFVRPSADPLFSSVAMAFGKFSIGVVLTGLGSDGAEGSMYIEELGGQVYIENPETANAGGMPQATLDYNPKSIVKNIGELGGTISKAIFNNNARLKKLQENYY